MAHIAERILNSNNSTSFAQNLKKVVNETRAQMGSIDKKKTEEENLTLLSLKKPVLLDFVFKLSWEKGISK